MTIAAPRLLSLATAVPPFEMGQREVAERARRIFSGVAKGELDRLMPVFANAGIARRYSCVPIDWYESPHGWVDRNALYLDNATRLLEDAARRALEAARLRPGDVDAVVCVSTTGIATPSLDAVVAGRLGLRPDVRRLPVFGLGCAGGVNGLASAVDLARAAPGSRVLFLVVELCALSFRRHDISKSNIVATALFGDGAAAAVVSSKGYGPAFGNAGEHTWPSSLDIMGWDVAEDGLKAIFSRDIPALVERDLRAVVGDFLRREDLRLGDIRHYVCHPGGAKVVTALEAAFELPAGALDSARGVLSDYGNMSAPTVLFVLDRVLRSGAEGRMLLTALGPGFTAGMLRLDVPG
ncbi:MAG TPA: 3-oxoacyl-[acyl-carrier-protein] synthase III C-terminal domain-containing protein [Stellaceae bacterium]|nr:3-oxoacyl-[acyl-carrier-protein] synthase III C-terminal domain-containing protein [Stellaceae bacterium]